MHFNVSISVNYMLYCWFGNTACIKFSPTHFASIGPLTMSQANVLNPPLVSLVYFSMHI